MLEIKKRFLPCLSAMILLLTGCLEITIPDNTRSAQMDEPSPAGESSETSLKAKEPAASVSQEGSGSSAARSAPDASEQTAQHGDEVKTVTLYANLSNGSEIGEIKAYETVYAGALTVEDLAEALSELCGLEFLITAAVDGDTITVDWSADCALFTDTKPKDGFEFPSGEARCWFLLDSLWSTVAKAFGTDEIYYTMDGGRALRVPEITSPEEFPPDIPYLGSPFYVHHSNLRD